jgi:hypothetical protein
VWLSVICESCGAATLVPENYPTKEGATTCSACSGSESPPAPAPGPATHPLLGMKLPTQPTFTQPQSRPLVFGPEYFRKGPLSSSLAGAAPSLLDGLEECSVCHQKFPPFGISQFGEVPTCRRCKESAEADEQEVARSVRLAARERADARSTVIAMVLFIVCLGSLVGWLDGGSPQSFALGAAIGAACCKGWFVLNQWLKAMRKRICPQCRCEHTDPYYPGTGVDFAIGSHRRCVKCGSTWRTL